MNNFRIFISYHHHQMEYVKQDIERTLSSVPKHDAGESRWEEWGKGFVGLMVGRGRL
jgi:hypothetical protein